jgi:GNAT superfamily N-acetyltransferase
VALEVSAEAYGSAVVRPLTDALEAELLPRYPRFQGSGDEPDTAAFAWPHGLFLVGWLDGAALACGGLCRFDAETAEIRRMYVAPPARGRGIGRKLLHRLLEAAEELGYARVRLETGDGQLEAINLYRSAGFESIPCWGPYVEDARSVCLEKDLSHSVA